MYGQLSSGFLFFDPFHGGVLILVVFLSHSFIVIIIIVILLYFANFSRLIHLFPILTYIRVYEYIMIFSSNCCMSIYLYTLAGSWLSFHYRLHNIAERQACDWATFINSNPWFIPNSTANLIQNLSARTLTYINPLKLGFLYIKVICLEFKWVQFNQYINSWSILPCLF